MGRGKKKILLIDASSAGLMVGKMILGRGAYDVVTARSGHEGLEKALAERPDLIVLSAGTGPTTGAQASKACEALRAHEDTRATPIVLVTARSKSQPGGVGRGTCGYVTKPIDGLELLTMVRSRLGESSRGSQGQEA
jgi:DNA-binding response OmpR family regulator